MRLECDPLADDAVFAAVRYHGERVLKCHELYSTIKELGETFQDPSCSRFLEFYEHEPPWNVDWEKCDSGRRFFVRNSAIAGLVLMYCSLVGSFTAAFGNKVSLQKLCNSRGWGLLSCQSPEPICLFFQENPLCSYILMGNHVRVKSLGIAHGVANARPPGLTNAPQ